MSSNGLMTYKNKWLSFINKGIITLLLGLMLIVIVPCLYLLFAYWSEMPIFIKIFCPILLVIIFVGLIITPLNGMIITKKGTILFFPDFRLKKLDVKDKKLAMSMYTINKRKMERICNKLLDLNICVTTILDKNRNIIYQNK